MTIDSNYSFSPELHQETLISLIDALDALEGWDKVRYEQILRRYPKEGRGFFSKAQILSGFRHFNRVLGWERDEQTFADKIRMKPVRTLSGVAPVTVLTKPFPCPGRCIFCPSDVRMPKSYLSDEPGAQRAAQHQFDPYRQTFSRLRALSNIGHRTDKVEMIILGGTWSYYPEAYQIWFVKRCFDALNDFSAARRGDEVAWPEMPTVDFREVEETVDGRRIEETYNQVVRRFARDQQGREDSQEAEWSELETVQRANETTQVRCVGLVVETRPDHLDLDEVVRIRRLGATKVQIGFQSLSDEVLELNQRGHDVAATHRAVALLRGAGFKLHAHWMPNLYGSSPAADLEDFQRIFTDPGLKPDELKIYPCSLIASAELMKHYENGSWKPYSHEELLEVVTGALQATPEYCRLTRVIRDIPGTDIVDGNKLTNFRELAERALAERGLASRDIRAREVRDSEVRRDELELRRQEFETSLGSEIFLQFVTPDDRLAGFLRLSLPDRAVEMDEIRDSAMIPEVHVYGRLVEIGQRDSGRSQHLGLGRSLIEAATGIAAERGFANLAVISSVGTREYYRGLGFEDGPLYQHLKLAAPATGVGQETG
jgi:elongator complex protein 3